MRRPAITRRPARGPVSKPASYPAPIKGWVTSMALADMKADTAILLDNWFPEADSIRPRRGSKLYASGLGGRPVETLASFVSGPIARLFAATGATVYDVTDPARPVASLVGQRSARWSAVNFTVSGGPQLLLFNGIDAPQRFDGVSWSPVSFSSTAPSFKLAAITTAVGFAQRLWLAQGTTLYYAPIDSYGGGLQALQVGGEFKRGGTIAALSRWSQNVGQTVSDWLVVISTEGEVVCYQGTDPTASNWALVGVYDIAQVLGGERCTARLGGDLAILTRDGLQAMSKVLTLDRAQSDKDGAFTSAIRNIVKDDAEAFGANFGWSVHVHRERSMLYINLPLAENIALARQYVMNVQTGAWCRFIGLNASCWHSFQGRLYFGAANGQVVQADTGYGDLGQPTGYASISAFSDLAGRGAIKHCTLVRAITAARAPVPLKVGVAADFLLSLPAGAINLQQLGASRFARSVFGAPTQSWGSGTAVGVSLAPTVFLQLDATTPVGAEPRVTAFDMVIERGGLL